MANKTGHASRHRKRMLWRDIRATFRKSRGRFVSIVLLIMLGSFALVGLKVTGPDMRATAEHYVGAHDLADVTVIGGLGLDGDDERAISQASGVREVEYGYLKDMMLKGTDDAIRVVSVPERVSRLEVADGRMPRAEDEVALDANMAGDHPVGSTVEFVEKADASGSETLSRHEFAVVGHVRSMELLSNVNKGNTQVGTGDLSGYAVVPASVFDVDYHMLARITYEDTRGLDPYSQAYLDKVAAHKDELAGFLGDAPDRRLLTVRDEYDSQIAEGQGEVDDARRQLVDAKGQLDDAKAQLDEARGQLDAAPGQIEEGRAQISQAEAQIADGAAQIEDARRQIDDNARRLDEAASQLASGRQSLDENWASLETAKGGLARAASTLTSASGQLAEGQRQIEENEARLGSAKEQVASYDEARRQVAEAQAQVKAYDEGRAQVAAGNRELETARKGLASKQARLDEAAAQLDAQADAVEQARTQTIPAAERQVADAQAQIDDATSQLNERQAAYDEQAGRVAASRRQLEAARAKAAELQATVDGLDARIAEAEAALDAPDLTDERRAELETLLARLQGERARAQASLEQASAQVSQAEPQVEAAEAELAKAKSQLDAASSELSGKREELERWKASLAETKARVQAYDDGRAQLERGREQAKAAQAQIDDKAARLAAATAELDAKAGQVEAARAQVEKVTSQLDALAPQVEAARAQVEAGERELAAAKGTLAAKQAEYERGVASYRAGKASYDEGLARWQAAAREVDAGQATYDSGVAQLALARQTLGGKLDELASARAQVAGARQTLAEKVAEYQRGLADYDAGLAEYRDGLAEYEGRLPDVEREIADAEGRLADAREARDALERPSYDVDSRRETPGSEGYVTYDSVSEIIDSLANIFPYFLYLVAALVASTTMTRMVDEERINSGTLKALGYEDSDVLKKFLVYGATAGGIGSALGIALGHTAMPLIVYNAYHHGFSLPVIELHFHPGVALAALALGLAVVVVPAALVAKREVRECPARLLLPKPPAKGSKVLLERIPLIWNRLGFTGKVTVRNLFRYKARMAMTVVGVAGAVCLIFCGFAVQHSIDGISTRQFGDIIDYDLIVAQKSHAGGDDLQAIDRQLGSDAVEAHSPVCYESLTRRAGEKGDVQSINLIVPTDEKAFARYLHLRDRASGRELSLPSDGAIISERLADLIGVREGDDLTFEDADGVERTVRVAGVCEMYMEHFMFMGPEAYRATFGRDAEPNAHVVSLRDDGLENTREQAARFMELDGVLGVVQSAALINQIDIIVASLNKIMLVLIVVAIALAVVIVYNLVTINVAERIRELSTVKVLGFFDNEVSMYIYRETIINSAVALPVGWLLGWLLQQYVITAVPPETVMFDPACGWLPFAVSAAVVAGVVAVMYVTVNRQLRDVDMLEALKSVD